MDKKIRVAVVTSDVPFVEGGHLTIARSTVKALKQYGVQADMILTPQNRFGRQLRAYLATRFIDIEEDGLGRKIHQVISFRFPSFAVKHPAHVCWLNHRLREYYDLWEVLACQLSTKGKIKEKAKRFIIRTLDNYLLKRNVTKLFSQSKTIQSRLKKWGNIHSEVLYPPPPQRNYYTESYDNFIFAVSRLQKLKRLDLFIEAFKHTQNKNLKGIIIGDGQEKTNLVKKINELNLAKRVFIRDTIDEESVLSHYARCRAVFFAPLKEDYGFITGEAFSSRKAVITTIDSGGPAELVENGQSGYIINADPKEIGNKFDELAEDKIRAEKMGERGYEFISRFSWPETVKKLIIV